MQAGVFEQKVGGLDAYRDQAQQAGKAVDGMRRHGDLLCCGDPKVQILSR